MFWARNVLKPLLRANDRYACLILEVDRVLLTRAPSITVVGAEYIIAIGSIRQA